MESASTQSHTFIQRRGWKKLLLLSFKTISNSTTSMRSYSLVTVPPTDCSGQGHKRPDDGSPSHLICLEPTEAFNTVYHDILLTHLCSITGLSESVLGCFSPTFQEKWSISPLKMQSPVYYLSPVGSLKGQWSAPFCTSYISCTSAVSSAGMSYLLY